MTDQEQTFTFDYQTKPDLVNVDGDKILLCEKKDNKTLDNYIHQYRYAANYLDRREAIDACAAQQDDPKALALLKDALKDPFYGLRTATLNQLDMKKATVKAAVEQVVADLAKNEKKPAVRAKAISVLGTYNKPEYKTLFATALNDSSYSVAGAALEAISIVDAPAFVNEVNKLKSKPAKGKLGEIMGQVMMETGTEEDFNAISKNFDKLPLSDAKLEALQPFSQYLTKINNTENFKKGVNMIVSVRNAIPAAYQAQITPFINNVILKGIVSKKKADLKGDKEAEVQKQIDFVNGVIEGKK